MIAFMMIRYRSSLFSAFHLVGLIPYFNLIRLPCKVFSHWRNSCANVFLVCPDDF